MMKKLLIFFILFSISFIAIAASKDVAVTTSREVENKLYDLEHKVKIIDANQLNYKIEKDLLKETYSNNYDKINIFITFTLGFIAIIGFLGIRDINAIKEKFEKELNEIKEIKNQFDLKSNEFDDNKKKIDGELKTIIEVNQEQSSKIKFIELKEKIGSLYNDRKLTLALEFTNAALEINQSDPSCLNVKGSILIQLNQIPDGLAAFHKAIQDNPDDTSSKLNYAECLYFSGKIDEAKQFIGQNEAVFKEKYKDELLDYFKIIELYFENNLEQLKEIAKGYVTHDNMQSTSKRLGNWNLTDAQLFAHYRDDSDIKTALQNIIWYWNDKINGEELLAKLRIPLPDNPDQE